MGSPVTFSGFNKIDFGMILDAVMVQERAPITELEKQQRDLQSRATTYRTLAGHLSTFQSAIDALVGNGATAGHKVGNSDASALTASTGAGTAVGIYDVEVHQLARAQVTASASFPPDPDKTVVAWGGALTIGGVAVAVPIDGPVTLQGLADLINRTANIPVTATVIRAAADSWQLVLTGKSTGLSGTFDIQNALLGPPSEDPEGPHGPPGITFSGLNAVDASDARVSINNVTVTSSTNTITNAIPGVTLTLAKQTTAPVTLNVTEDTGSIRSRVEKFIDAFNQLVKFADDQRASAGRGEGASVGRDPLLRALHATLRGMLNASYPAGNSLTSLATAGIEMDRTGRLKLNNATFDEVAGKSRDDLHKLFAADGDSKGVFRVLQQAVKAYTASDGLLRSTQDRLTGQTSNLARRISELEARLALRRSALQKEYMAADMAMSRMNADVSSLSTLANQFQLF